MLSQSVHTIKTEIFLRIRFVLILLLCNSSLILVLAQGFEVRGTIKEKGTEVPVPFAHVFFKGTQIGTTSDLDGNFVLKVKTETKSDTIVFQSLGYITLRKKVVRNAIMKIELEPELMMMEEVRVVAGENPAYAMMDKIIEHKDLNNPENRENYSCQEYSKIRFDLNHFTEKIKDNVLLKPFDYIWDNVDTTEDGVTYLPVLLMEKNSEHYFRKSPRKEKSIVKAVNTTGLPGPKLLEFAEDLYFTPNIYNNYVVILDKNFPSPLNNNFKLHYEYYLDSTGTGTEKEYLLTFQPKYNRQLAFVGEMRVDAKSYAVKYISLRFDIMANVNFVRSYLVQQKYDNVDGGHWMLTESSVLGDFTVIENQTDLTGFFGRKKSTFYQYVVDKAEYKDEYDGIAKVEQIDSATLMQDDYWSEQRKDTLSEKEQGVMEMVQRIENDPKFILRKNIILGFTTGYIPWKNVDIGDFYSFYSYNYVEHSRVKFGFRSHTKLDFPLSGSIYGAYGFNDEKWKYGLESRLRLGKKNTFLGVSLSDDIIQIGRSVNAIKIDHVLASLVQIGGVTSRVYKQEYKGYIEQKLFTGLTCRVEYFSSRMSPTDTVRFLEIENQSIAEVPDYIANGLGVTLKFNWQNKEVNSEVYSKADLKNEFRKFPDLTFNYQYVGQEFGSTFNYEKLTASIQQQLRTKSLGYFKYYVESGITNGTVPYPFLNTPFSNQLVLYDDFAFNLMNYLEFVADQYVTANVQHHFDGAILDVIPLINRLKWRSFVFAKGYWGELRSQNLNSKYKLPSGTSPIQEPYYEVGFGFENILKIARMDFVWRLNDTTLPDTYSFIIKPSFSFSF